jgi:hypothetical protein
MLTECIAIKLLKNKDSEIYQVMRGFKQDNVTLSPQKSSMRKRELKLQEKMAQEPELSCEESDEVSGQNVVRNNPYFYRLRKQTQKVNYRRNKWNN